MNSLIKPSHHVIILQWRHQFVCSSSSANATSKKKRYHGFFFKWAMYHVRITRANLLCNGRECNIADCKVSVARNHNNRLRYEIEQLFKVSRRPLVTWTRDWVSECPSPNSKHRNSRQDVREYWTQLYILYIVQRSDASPVVHILSRLATSRHSLLLTRLPAIPRVEVLSLHVICFPARVT